MRKLHLYSAFSLMGFIFMYFTTGFIMTHSDWFERHKYEPTSSTFHFEVSPGLSPKEIAARIQQTYNLNGKIAPPRLLPDSTFFFQYVHPGMHHEARLFPHEQKLEIKSTPGDFIQISNTFHRIHGYGGGWPYDVYVLFMDLSSLSMLLFAATGIYLWLRLIKHKWLGWAIMAASLIYTCWVISLFMY